MRLRATRKSQAGDVVDGHQQAVGFHEFRRRRPGECPRHQSGSGTRRRIEIEEPGAFAIEPTWEIAADLDRPFATVFRAQRPSG